MRVWQRCAFARHGRAGKRESTSLCDARRQAGRGITWGTLAAARYSAGPGSGDRSRGWRAARGRHAARARRTATVRRLQPDWAALARRLNGRLLRPGDQGYVTVGLPYNRRYVAEWPGGVALCADVADVQTAWGWARHYGLPFAARSGGHSYGGYSASRGLIITLARINRRT